MTTRTLIMAVPWDFPRMQNAARMAKAIGGEIVFDKEHNPLETWERTLQTAGQDPVIILEDDIQLTENWRNKIEAVIAERPEDVIQFFSLKPKDLTLGSRYESGSTFIMNQCHYLPAGAAYEIWQFLPTWLREHPEEADGHDLSTSRWLSATKRKYWLHVPSLVQHEGWQSEIHPKRPRNRQSRTFE